MTHHDESTAQTTRFDTTREFMPGLEVPAESLGSIMRRTIGRDHTPAGREYVGRHRQEATR